MKLLLSWTLILVTLFSQSVLAEKKDSEENSQKPKITFNLPTPPSQGIPQGRHKGGGSRSNCQNYQNLTAIVPLSNNIVWGKTIANHPEFLFYLPQGSNIEFVLQDEEDNYIYQTDQKISPDSQGIIKISLPDTVKPLESGEIYQWTLSISCDVDNPSAFVYVQGSIAKVSLDANIESQLSIANNTEKVIIYAEQGIWYDAIALLAQLRQENPNDTEIETMWVELLEQVNLAELASESML